MFYVHSKILKSFCVVRIAVMSFTTSKCVGGQDGGLLKMRMSKDNFVRMFRSKTRDKKPLVCYSLMS